MDTIERWQWLKNADQIEHRFVVMLSPILEYIYQAVLQHIQSLPVVTVLFEEFDIQKWLSQDLCHLFSPMLSRSCVLEIYYAKHAGLLTGETPEERFQSFIDLLEKPEFVTQFMQKYHVLQGIIDRRATNYLNALCEFLNHLNHDFANISKQLLTFSSNFKLDKLTSEGADVHCQGKRVFILHFLDSNNHVERIVYKPHQLDPELAFNHIIQWINPWIPESTLLPMKLINDEDHGWVEFFEHRPCSNEDEIKIFYQRSGHLLALLYLFHGLDIHFDNIIAHGAYPILIDLECFLTPIKYRLNTQPFSFPTVLDCMLLPSKVGNDQQKSGIDLSALGFSGGENWYTKAFSWENAGTDEMRFARIDSTATSSCNQPFIKKIGDIDYLNYEKEISKGFEKAYLILLNHRNNFIEQFSNELSQIQIRLVFRATSQYYELLIESYHPSLLRNPSDYEAHMNWLKECLKIKPEHEPLIESEYNDLSNGDIPYFCSKTNDLDVFNSYGQKTGYRMQQSGWELFLSRMNSFFSAADCDKQKYLIKMSFALAKLNHEKKSAQHTPIHTQPPQPQPKTMESVSETYLSHAECLLDELSNLILIANNQIAWPDIELDVNAKYPVFNPALTNKSIYSGSLGILLTFLYGQQQIPKPTYKNIISACLSSLTADILDDNVDHWNKNISAFSGYGSVLYILCLAEQFGFLSNIELYEKMIQKIQQHLKEDNVYDVLGGAAGTLLVLLKIYKDKKSINVKPLINELVQHLLQEYPDPALLPESLKENYHFSSPGFSHGVAGIAFALWQARVVFSNHQTETWIESALIYIKKLHDQHGYFPDARNLDKEVAVPIYAHPPLWCHGHVGIGLFYLDLHRHNSPLTIHAPLSIIQKEMIDLEHKISEGNLCCGSLGELELLYQYEQFTQSDEAHRLFTNEVHRLFYDLDQKNYSLYTKGAGFSTNLMQGKSGIAYTLLRLNDPKLVSPVLLLQ